MGKELHHSINKVFSLLLLVLMIIYFAKIRLIDVFKFNDLPNITLIFKEVVAIVNERTFYNDLFLTTYRVVLGGLLGEICSVIISILTSRNSKIKKFINPFLSILQHTPIIAMVPLIIVIAPNTESSIILIIMLSSFLGTFNVNTSIFSEISLWNRYYVSLFSDSKLKSILSLEVCYLTHNIEDSLLPAFSASWGAVVTSEVLSGTTGLGFELWQSFLTLNFSKMLSYLIIIIIWGELMRLIIKYACGGTTWTHKK